jgi:transcriptional regulator NrdR family protein
MHKGFTCPRCNQETFTTDSRMQKGYRRRRYRCTGCELRFTTREVVVKQETGNVVMTNEQLTELGL